MKNDKNDYIWTPSGARLCCMSPEMPASALNWLFVPAPGLGSDSLTELVMLTKEHLNSRIWLLDHPNDGDNLSDKYAFANWASGLIEAVTQLDRPVVVAHSTGGMFVQSIPALEKLASGLVLLNTAPDMAWKEACNQQMQQNSTPEIEVCANRFGANPNNESLRALIVSSLKFSFMPQSLARAAALLNRLPINYSAANWSDTNFDPSYSAKFIPQSLPTLIISGEYDQITPLTEYSARSEYQRANIWLYSISNAKHYPWFDNPSALVQAIQDFAQK